MVIPMIAFIFSSLLFHKVFGLKVLNSSEILQVLCDEWQYLYFEGQ